MKGTDIIVDVLRSEGIEVAFGYPGGAVIPLYDKLYDVKDIKFILPRNEQGGGFMAQGYSRVTGKPGVVISTSGPGATNLVTPICDAHLDSIPLVAITGQVKSHLIGNDAFQEADIIGVTRSITKHNYLVKDPEELPRVMKEAFHIAKSGRPGPVLVDIPSDIQLADIKAKIPKTVNIPSYQPQTQGNDKQVQRVANLINSAERPLLYVGGGAIASNAAKYVKQMAEQANIPVTMTLMGLGAFPGSHKLSLDMLGMHGTCYANLAVSECDVLICVGARFDDRVTGDVTAFGAQAEVVHIDIDPTSISKNVVADWPIVGDVSNVLKKMLPHLKKKARQPWLKKLNGWKSEYPLRYSERGLRGQNVIQELYNLTKKRRTIVTTDVGQHQMWAAQFFKFDHPRSFLSSSGLGTMGFGMPAAIGAQFADPEALVICFSGDGSIQMNIQELLLMSTHKLPIITVILNNGFLGMVRQWQQLLWKKRYSHVDLSDNPDFIKIAEAFGMTGMRITKPSEVIPTLKKALALKAPVLIDAVIEAEANVYPMIPAGGTVDQMLTGIEDHLEK